jgi:hypothetical protein
MMQTIWVIEAGVLFQDVLPNIRGKARSKWQVETNQGYYKYVVNKDVQIQIR